MLDEYKQGKPTVQYTRALRGGATRVEQITQTEYIRHQIHHPENTHNVRFSDEDLRTSIDMMRTFIQTQN